MSKESKQSVFMQMHNGTRTGEGSFNVGLRDLFYLADNANKRKLGAHSRNFSVIQYRSSTSTHSKTTKTKQNGKT